MALAAVKHWFGRQVPPSAESPRAMPGIEPNRVSPEAPPSVTPGPPPTWNADRLLTTDGLWGEGYQFPGGEIETLRLAKPMGLSRASSLLLIGAGAGGAACSL